MDCPACRTPSLRQTLGPAGVVVDRCASCGGTWLDRGEIDWHVKDAYRTRDLLNRAFAGAPPSDRACPRCRDAMVAGTAGTASLERCPRCEGIWADAGDIEGIGGDAAPLPPAAAPPPPGTASAAPMALPSLALRAGAVLAAMYGLLFAFLFVLVETDAVAAGAALVLGVAVIGMQFFLGPWLMDLTLGWFQGLRWSGTGLLPEGTRRFLEEACARRGIPVPRLGIIEDGNPNAFTYGHIPGNARLVVTRGCIDMLDEEELTAVVGHELGHVVHWDMLVMTVAALVPVFLYYAYRTLLRATRWVGAVRVKKARGGVVATAALAAAAYLAYVITRYLLLFLSRTRELHADRFSGEATGNPNALSSALVKIAYGLAGSGAPPADEAAKRRREGAGVLQTLGIFDGTAARALVASAAGISPRPGKAEAASAMQWDIWNPWATWYEIHSSHPLPARRIQHLSAQAAALGQAPAYRFDLNRPESYWDEFLVDVAAALAPWALGLLGLVAAFLSGADENRGFLLFFGLPLLGFAVGYMIRLWFSYRGAGNWRDTSIAGLLKIVKVSGVRGVPARVKGTVIGRGIPGHFLSEDMVLQDHTGFLLLDYTQPFSPLEWWFALFRRNRYEGQEVVAEGWYRRAPVPYFEVRRVHCAGDARKSWTIEGRVLLGILMAAGGVLLVLAGM